MISRERLGRLGADVEAEPAVGNVVHAGCASLGIGGEAARGDDVRRQLDRKRERVVNANLLGHLASDQHAIGAPTEVLENRELVVDLGAACDDHERMLDVSEKPAEVLDLGEEQEACIRGQEPGDAFRRAVGAMSRAECVVDVEIHPLRELGCVAGVVRRLPRVEPRVLAHAQAIVREELPQMRRDRGDREASVILRRLRSAEMRARRRPLLHRGRAASEASAATPGSGCRLRSLRRTAER